MIHKADAITTFKIKKDDLDPITARLQYGSRSSNAMHYITAAVESLAFRLHGGPEAHRAHVEKVNAKVQKQQGTRAKNAAAAAEAECQESLDFAQFGPQYSDLPGWE